MHNAILEINKIKYQEIEEKDFTITSQYESYDKVKSLTTTYYNVIEYCLKQKRNNKIIDFGCGIGLGGIVFKKEFPNPNAIFVSYSKYDAKIYNYYLKELDIESTVYKGNINNSTFKTEYCEVPADIIICLRLDISDYAINNFLKYKMIDEKSSIIYSHLDNNIQSTFRKQRLRKINDHVGMLLPNLYHFRF
jgi:hypothetical protein